MLSFSFLFKEVMIFRVMVVYIGGLFLISIEGVRHEWNSAMNGTRLN